MLRGEIRNIHSGGIPGKEFLPPEAGQALTRLPREWSEPAKSSRSVWTMDNPLKDAPGRIVGVSYAGPGVGLDNPCGSLPTQEIL